MSLADIHAQAQRFQSRVRSRNMIEYAAAAFVIAAFAWIAAAMPEPVVRIGAGLIVLGAIYVCWKLHRLGRAATQSELEAGAQSWAGFHRAELTRQREALRTVWSWYLAPFVPGMLVFLAGVSFTPENPAPLPVRLGVFLAGVGIMAAVFAMIAWLNAVAAKRLDAEIAALDRARE
jgi:glucan phosphoethanolaminetransferase (alkaline phosphatase superfamily)